MASLPWNAHAVACVNMKGGVGKTTTAMSLAHAVAAAGGRSLLVDMDHQINATDFLEPEGLESEPEALTVYDVIASRQSGAYRAARRPSSWMQLPPIAEASGGVLDVVPGDTHFLDKHVLEYGSDALALALEGSQDEYDLIVFDCPPSTGPVVQSALLACSEVLLITESKQASLNSFARFVEFLNELNETLDRYINVSGILITRYKTAETEHRSKLRILKEHYPDALLPVRIPERAVVAKAESRHKPVAALLSSEPEARIVASAYAAVAHHLLLGMDHSRGEIVSALAEYVAKLSIQPTGGQSCETRLKRLRLP